ncbi:uncharacterized protein BDV14DRAFT_196782 [Aspergillus stella-maris]|uniref:uncharacterized protein n=1 Tax=Aspergillus stella-maris TaxID=1810926 RepID=UPI003CCE29DB
MLVMGPRYSFCLFVHEICLASLDETPGRLVVKFLARDYAKVDPEAYRSYDYKVCDDHGFEDGITDDPNEAVGWMYIETAAVFGGLGIGTWI